PVHARPSMRASSIVARDGSPTSRAISSMCGTIMTGRFPAGIPQPRLVRPRPNRSLGRLSLVQAEAVAVRIRHEATVTNRRRAHVRYGNACGQQAGSLFFEIVDLEHRRERRPRRDAERLAVADSESRRPEVELDPRVAERRPRRQTDRVAIEVPGAGDVLDRVRHEGHVLDHAYPRTACAAANRAIGTR